MHMHTHTHTHTHACKHSISTYGCINTSARTLAGTVSFAQINAQHNDAHTLHTVNPSRHHGSIKHTHTYTHTHAHLHTHTHSHTHTHTHIHEHTHTHTPT